MPKFLKQGKVVLVLQGRFAGRKAVIVRTCDDGSKDRPYPHCVVAGIDRYPLPITKNMPKKKVAKRSRVKPFVKTINYSHIMPTRYNLDVDLKQVSESSDPAMRVLTKKAVRKVFEERYNSAKNKWFFQKLRF